MKLKVPFRSRPPIVPVIRLSGVIGGGGRLSPGLTDAGLAPLIERAFRKGKPAAVALAINSPGGSPAQSSLIGARIRRLGDEMKVPVLAFTEDVAASGGYWLACAADEIFADDTSILGSIGVISASFGFPEFLARHGIERRVHTAGGSKSFLDPFRPEKPDDIARLTALQEQIHRTFIAHVQARRGARLDTTRDLFTGEIFVGAAAVEAGLADGIGHLAPVLKERFGDKVRLQPMGRKKPIWRRLGVGPAGGGAAADIAAQVTAEALGAVEDRAHWARFGL
ncbi:S49 family peptidase [Frigidibacter sp. MR17.24]|uniref:S49 family peptidase n=1 Tax=Frigidibacter sp. MR17.24 TaxID=3127345 RepID=UPI003012EADD